MKAIALISGGLDSILAAKLVEQQGIEVIYLNFKIPFCHKDRDGTGSRIQQNFGIDLKTVDLSSEFLEIINNPKYGFGSNMNPCIDCKILMLERAKGLMKDWGAEFVVTGEVLGQRPMSQNRHALKLIEKRCGLEGLLLRPLSAKNLEETLPERRGWVDRKNLLDLSGRGRKPQMGLANELGIKDYPNPAGGCLLTDPEFSDRLKETIEHQELSLETIELLKLGRHFRLGAKEKLIVGRNERENNELSRLAKEGDYLFNAREDMAGPTALGRGDFNQGLIELSCKIVCRYCDLNGKIEADIIYRQLPGNGEKVLRVAALHESRLAKLRL